jgi:hypothetical protein
MNKFTFVITILFFAFILQSCDKHRAKKYEGTYSGVKVTESWVMGGPTNTTSVPSTLIIGRNKQSLIIDNWVFHVDELDESESYQGGVSNYLKLIQFDNHSVYYSSSSGSLGGGTSYSFSGTKD